MSLSSQEWRQRGNEDFANARGEPAILIEQYNSALLCYKHAMDLANNEKDYSSAAKNAGATYLKLVVLYRDTQLWNRVDRIRVAAGALEFYSKAKSRGNKYQSEAWISQIKNALKESIQEASNLADEFHGQEKARVLQLLVKEVVHENFKRLWLLRAVEVLVSEAKNIPDDDEKARDILSEAIKPLERAKALGGLTVHWENTIDEAKRVVCASIEFKKATHVLENATTNRSLQVNLLLVAIDLFSNAIKVAEDVNKEVEAKAYSELGNIYEQHFSYVERAKSFFRKCVYIADNILPKVFLKKDWYLRATEGLKRYQKKAVDDSEDAEYQERKDYLQELKKELDQLKENAAKGIPTLLEFISKEFPPKGASLTPYDAKALKNLDNKSLRKEVLKLVVRYHPDKQSGQEMKWKVLCEEITKQMNKMLENLKCST